jgi:DUF1680 family protein
MTETLRRLPLREAVLLPGLFKNRSDLNREYVLSLKTANLLQNHYLEAGLWGPHGMPEHAHWGWESPTCQIRGEFLGHWLSAAAHIVATSGDLEIKGKADFIVSEVARCQQENGGEWAGPIPEKYLDWLARGKTVWAPHCTIHRNMMGLYDMYAWTGNQQALDILVKWARWFHRWTGQFTQDHFARMLDIETGGMLESWADLYGVTGDKEHLELVNRYYHRHLFDPLLSGQDVLTNQHANTTIPEIQGAARAWEVTGEERWREVVEAYWCSAVVERGYYATGGQTSGEYWTPPSQLSARLGDKNQEHCTVYNMMRVADYLLRWTGETSYADYWERNLYNGTLAQQNATTGMVAYFLPMRSGSSKQWGTPTENFWCCHGTLIQAQSQYLNHIVYGGDDGSLVISQYIPCELEFDHRGARVKVTLSAANDAQPQSRPGGRMYDLKVESDPPQQLAIKFRVPWWIKGAATLSVNGEDQTSASNPSSYAAISRTWPDDTVRLTLPHGLTTEPLPDRPSTVAFMEGPVVLAGVLGEGPARSGKDWSPQMGVETLSERPLLARPEDPAAVLVPDSDWEFSGRRIGYRTIGQAQNFRLIPLYEIRDESYAIYFPIERPSKEATFDLMT